MGPQCAFVWGSSGEMFRGTKKASLGLQMPYKVLKASGFTGKLEAVLFAFRESV